MLTDRAPTRPPPSGAALRWFGTLEPAHLTRQPARGRRRRWVYVAAGDERLVVGAAVVDLGLFGLGTAFAFCAGPWGLLAWDGGPGRAGRVGGLDGTAIVRSRGAVVELDGHGLRLDVPVTGGRLRADVVLAPAAPVSLLTPTPHGGWNATTKAAGHPATGTVDHPAGSHELDGAAWTDATDGRQDRHTTWRWAAGAGRSADGTAVGVQASTGMNAMGPGEDLLWWDGSPAPLTVDHLAPTDPARPAGAWRLAGPGWSLELEPAGARAATEGLGPLRSRYCQPAGAWRGTLPAPDGRSVPVRLAGVAEDHEARW